MKFVQSQYREAGVWSFSGETFVSDLSYHQVNGGGDTCQGYDVLLFTKGMNGIKADAEAPSCRTEHGKPGRYRSHLLLQKQRSTPGEGVINYAHRIAARARVTGCR